MIVSVLQSVSELAQNGVGATIVGMINLAAIAGVFVQGWIHRISTVEKTSHLDKQLTAMNVTLKSHIGSTPTHEVCLSRMARIENVIRDENKELRNDLQVLTMERNGAVARNDQRIRDLEYWRARTTPDRED